MQRNHGRLVEHSSTMPSPARNSEPEGVAAVMLRRARAGPSSEARTLVTSSSSIPSHVPTLYTVIQTLTPR